MSKNDESDTPDSKELADTRTNWAEDRTMLANERTFAAWMRTGTACVGLALGLKAVFSDTDYPVIAKSVAELFILCAVLIFGLLHGVVAALKSELTVMIRMRSRTEI